MILIHVFSFSLFPFLPPSMSPSFHPSPTQSLHHCLHPSLNPSLPPPSLPTAGYNIDVCGRVFLQMRKCWIRSIWSFSAYTFISIINNSYILFIDYKQRYWVVSSAEYTTFDVCWQFLRLTVARLGKRQLLLSLFHKMLLVNRSLMCTYEYTNISLVYKQRYTSTRNVMWRPTTLITAPFDSNNNIGLINMIIAWKW